MQRCDCQGLLVPNDTTLIVEAIEFHFFPYIELKHWKKYCCWSLLHKTDLSFGQSLRETNHMRFMAWGISPFSEDIFFHLNHSHDIYPFMLCTIFVCGLSPPLDDKTVRSQQGLCLLILIPSSRTLHSLHTSWWLPNKKLCELFSFCTSYSTIIPWHVGLPNSSERNLFLVLTQNKRLCNSVFRNYLDVEKGTGIFPLSTSKK